MSDDSSSASEGYENSIWDGELPAATGNLAKEFEKNFHRRAKSPIDISSNLST